MADDYKYVDTTGVIIPDTADLQAEIENEFKAVFGQDLITTPNTPQGVMITAETTARAAVLQNNAVVANQINPNMAGGVFLDAIWALTGGARYAATKSLVEGVQLLGLPGVFIPAGSQAALADGTLFESVADVTLDGGGNGTVDFLAVETGPVAVNVGALSQVVSGVLGWDQITNPTAAIIGRNQESDLASRQRRKNTLSLQNVALALSITSGLYALTDVRSLAFRENYTNAPVVIDGVSLVANSIWVCVYGGTNADVAAILLEHKSMGCNWNGAQTVNVIEPASGQTYTVKFDRPNEIAIQARVTVRAGSSLVDVQQAVRDAIVAYASGSIEGEDGFVVGGDVSAFELAGAVNRYAPGVYVQKCEVSLLSVTSWTDAVPITLYEVATILAGNIQVIIV